MAKFKYQGIETHRVIPAQKLLKKMQAEMEVNILHDEILMYTELR